jgi:hypothetical protein
MPRRLPQPSDDVTAYLVLNGGRWQLIAKITEIDAA